MAGVKNPNSDSTLDRRPMARAGEQGVTINEIEDRVRELYPRFSLDDMRTTSILFAILKQGCSTQKLQWFTSYDREFIQKRVEWLRSCGLLFTGALSTQYVLEQVPGSEDLIERITGQKVITKTQSHRAPVGYDWEKNVKASPVASPASLEAHLTNGKEKPMNTAINGAADAGAVPPEDVTSCGKSAACPKPDGHTGRCAGQGGSARGRQSNKAKADKAPGVKASRRKPLTNGHKPKPVSMTTALAAITGDGHYKIEYEDETRQFNFEGIGREAFIAALKSAEAALSGGPNG